MRSGRVLLRKQRFNASSQPFAPALDCDLTGIGDDFGADCATGHRIFSADA
jgi:hypothetical protein